MSAKESYFKAIQHSDLYEQLKTYIKCKNYSAISELLKQNNSEEFQQYIIDIGGNDLEIFGNSRPSEASMIVNKMVSAFSGKHQLNFISKLKVEHIHYSTFQLINDKESLLSSAVLQKYISYKMHNSKFEDIIKTNEVLNTNILMCESNYVSYHKKVITLPLLMNMQLKEKEYKGLYDIIYAYTAEKEQFLMSQYIALPSIETAQSITATIVKNIKSAQHDAEYFYAGLKNYSSRMMYVELQESLPNNNKTKSYTKI